MRHPSWVGLTSWSVLQGSDDMLQLGRSPLPLADEVSVTLHYRPKAALPQGSDETPQLGRSSLPLSDQVSTALNLKQSQPSSRFPGAL